MILSSIGLRKIDWSILIHPSIYDNFFIFFVWKYSSIFINYYGVCFDCIYYIIYLLVFLFLFIMMESTSVLGVLIYCIGFLRVYFVYCLCLTNWKCSNCKLKSSYIILFYTCPKHFPVISHNLIYVSTLRILCNNI